MINYEDVVKYPFGYGLSYTTFEQKMNDFSDNGDNVTFNVTVTNTGDVAGKDVVEVYFTPPYTNGGIEKASVNLIDYAKQVRSHRVNLKQLSLQSTKKIWHLMMQTRSK